MKIFGIGTDIVKISRIKKSIKKKSFIIRLFNKNEILKCKKIKNRIQIVLLKDLQLKRLFLKLLGTGIAKGINFNEIIVLNEKNGKPFIKLLDQTKKNVEKKLKKKYKISLSLSDEDNYAVAFVTISIMKKNKIINIIFDNLKTLIGALLIAVLIRSFNNSTFLYSIIINGTNFISRR